MTVQVHTVRWGTWPDRRPHRVPVTCGMCGRTIGYRPADGCGTWACRLCKADVIILPEEVASIDTGRLPDVD